MLRCTCTVCMFSYSIRIWYCSAITFKCQTHWDWKLGQKIVHHTKTRTECPEIVLDIGVYRMNVFWIHEKRPCQSFLQNLYTYGKNIIKTSVHAAWGECALHLNYDRHYSATVETKTINFTWTCRVWLKCTGLCVAIVLNHAQTSSSKSTVWPCMP